MRTIHSRYPADCMTMQRLEPDRSLAIRGLSVPWPDFSRIFSVCVLIVSFDIMEEINRRVIVLLVTCILTFIAYQTAIVTTDTWIDTYNLKNSHFGLFLRFVIVLVLLLLIFPSSCFDDSDWSGGGGYRRSCGCWRYITRSLAEKSVWLRGVLLGGLPRLVCW